MSKKKDKRERRKSTARRRAEQHASGFETTTLKVPEGLNFWELKTGTSEIDIIPYIVGGKGNKFADKGELHYERTFFSYRYIGIEEKHYVCSSKTWGKPDYIQEWRAKEAKKDDIDADTLKQYNPKERQVFLIYDHDDKSKGLQLWEISYFCFGKLLDSRITNAPEKLGWDLFYFPDEDGMSLRLTIEEETGGGYKFKNVMAIDFVAREDPLPDEIVNHKICLDDLLVETPFEKLKNIFKGVSSDDNEPEESSGEPKKERKKKPKTEPEEESDDEPEEDVEKTASDYGLEKNDEVLYKGEVHTIMKISKDGTSLMLLDGNEDLVKAISPADVELVKDDEPEEESQESKDKDKDENWDDGDEWDE